MRIVSLNLTNFKKRQRDVTTGTTVNTKNPQDFWNQINRLGPKKHNHPNGVKLEDGSITCNKSSVFRKWENNFKSLYNKDNPGVDDINYVNILKEKLTLENGSQDTNSDSLNREIALDEVIKIASKVKK